MTRKPELRGRAARLARLFPAGRAQAARTPFVLLVVLLLGGGLIGLLVLNSALSEGSFQLDDLQKRTKSLTDEEQALQRDIDAFSSPDALQRRARELGMVPGGDPAFLGPGGTVKGVPSAAPRSARLTGPLAPEAMTPGASPATNPSTVSLAPSGPSAPYSPGASSAPAAGSASSAPSAGTAATSTSTPALSAPATAPGAAAPPLSTLQTAPTQTPGR
ncbi:septum formation initiator family protein [Streptomyces sp. NPDC048297]|uniref:FtsB family cell division protein n=1 Tax=Streptomyces sp. NPDC048297 TaxID=3365531 RepID=UPI00371E30AF